MSSSNKAIKSRAGRVRRKLKSVANGRLRLSVYRSNMNIYAQIIDDSRGVTLVEASSLDSMVKSDGKSGANVAAATAVGNLLATRAVKQDISKIVFDRGSYLYHGRIKALADAAREGGLVF